MPQERGALFRRQFREAAATSIRMHEAAGAQQIFLAGQPFAPWKRGEDLEAFIEKINQLLIGPGGTPLFSAHQMCSAKLGSDPETSVAKPTGELHDVTGVSIADASGMPSCSGQPDGVHDGPRTPHGDEYAQPKALSSGGYSLIVTTTSAMTPRTAIKPAMIPDIEYGMVPTSAFRAFIF